MSGHHLDVTGRSAAACGFFLLSASAAGFLIGQHVSLPAAPERRLPVDVQSCRETLRNEMHDLAVWKDIARDEENKCGREREENRACREVAKVWDGGAQ